MPVVARGKKPERLDQLIVLIPRPDKTDGPSDIDPFDWNLCDIRRAEVIRHHAQAQSGTDKGQRLVILVGSEDDMRINPGTGEGACHFGSCFAMTAMYEFKSVELFERNGIAVGERVGAGHRENIFPTIESFKAQITFGLWHDGEGKINPTLAKPAL